MYSRNATQRFQTSVDTRALVTQERYVLCGELDVKSKIVDSINISGLEKELRNLHYNELKYLWTPTEIALIEEYIPSMYYRIAKELDIEKNGETKEKIVKLAFQIQSELTNKSSTIDAGIIHKRRDEGAVSSAIYNLGRINRILEILGMEPRTELPENVLTGDELDEILIQIKLRYADILINLPEWAQPVEVVNKRERLSSEQRQRYSYIDDILGICGEDVVAIALYGSASKETNPDNYSDYDNFLVVRNGSLEGLYPKLKGRKFTHQDGKHIGFNLVEESAFTKFIRLNHNPNEHLKHTTVLYGHLDFPVVSEAEICERGTSYAVLRAKSLKSACPWITKNPGSLLNKKALFDYFQKTPLFIIQSALNYTEGVACRTKDEIKSRLAEIGGDVLPFKPDRKYIVHATYQAAVWATQLLEKYYEGKRFDTSVLTSSRCLKAIGIPFNRLPDSISQGVRI